MGLIMNGFLKVPMQFIILFIGVMVFVFYQFYQPPIFFNQVQTEKLEQSEYSAEFKSLQNDYSLGFKAKNEDILSLLEAVEAENESRIDELKENIAIHSGQQEQIREEVKTLMTKNDPLAETRDTDYVFMRFVMDYLPEGVIGILFAVIFCAAMSSTSSELNALASTTTIDVYKRSVKKGESSFHYMLSSKWFTALWGIFAIVFANYAMLFENLIQAVNLLGSLFYGTILGIFLVGFYMQWVKGNAVFIAALLAEALILAIHWKNGSTLLGIPINIGFLWYNAIGCLVVMGLAAVIQFLNGNRQSR